MSKSRAIQVVETGKSTQNQQTLVLISLSLSLQGGPRASERARNAGLRDERSKAGRSWRCTDSEQASERARARVPQKNQIYIVNLGNFILNALGFGWVLCAARRIHSFIHPFIGEISKHHIYIYKVIAKKFKNQTC